MGKISNNKKDCNNSNEERSKSWRIAFYVIPITGIIITIIIAILTNCNFSNKLSYRGCVKELNTSHPIAEAKIKFEGLTDQISTRTTDSEGTFVVRLPKEYQDVKIVITAEGYETRTFIRQLTREFIKNTLDGFELIPIKKTTVPNIKITGSVSENNSTNKTNTPQPTIVSPEIEETVFTIYGEGTACTDSSYAWKDAENRAIKNLMDKLTEEQKINARKHIKIDPDKSSKPKHTKDGWIAEVIVYVYNTDLK